MDFQKVIENRRSVRVFLPQIIEADKIDALKEAALRSPTSRNFNPWNFTFVTNQEVLKQLSQAKEHGSVFLKKAPLGIVVWADESVSDVWIEDCSIASTYLFLAAEELELGACWIQIRNRKNAEGKNSELVVKELLNLPENSRVLSVIAIGYPEHKKMPISKDKLLWNKVSELK